MSIRFKFRSSISFDSIDLADRPSISVRDLRAKIVAQKKLQLGQDFDLVISDADTGIAFEDEDVEVKEGSSVVIKRVPANRSFVARDLDGGNAPRKIGGYKERVALPPPPPPTNVDMEDFDDFGIDLYPTIDESFPVFYTDTDDLNFTTNEKEVVQRCSEASNSRHQNIVRSDHSEALSKEVVGDNCCDEPDTVENKLAIKGDVHLKFKEYVHIPSPELCMDLPTELRCPLCNAIFKEAVMIPCCQHSFCDKCVRLSLIETGRCPRCLSMKCSIDHLLPNLSLRQAIEHFLEGQAMNNASNNIPQYAPDGESGIHAKDVSCAVSIRQKEPTCPPSPSTTWKGSNQVVEGSAYGGKRDSYNGSHLIRLESDKFGKPSLLPHMIEEMKGNENSQAQVLKHVTGLQGTNVSSKLPHNLLQKEANTTIQKEELGGIVSDGSGVFVQPSRYRKGDRKCYMCGSPDHLIRDCPEASNTYSVNQTGGVTFGGGMPSYPQAYWHGASYAHVGPYANIFGSTGVMSFNQQMVPVSPFNISPYMPSMYSGMHLPYGFMRVGGVQPHMMTGAERLYTPGTFMDTRSGERNHKSLNELPEREHDRGNLSQDYFVKGTRRPSQEERQQQDEAATGRFLDDDDQMIDRKHRHDKRYSFFHQQSSVRADEEIQTYERRHEKISHPSVSGRDQRAYQSGKSNSEAHYSSDSSNRHSRKRKKHHLEDCIYRQIERRGHYSSGLSQKIQHRSQKEMSDDENVTHHKSHSHRYRHHHHHHHPGSGAERSSSSERQHYKEKGLNQCSKQAPKSKDEYLNHDRWETGDGSDDDYKGKGHRHKHKRTQ